ncbi:SIP domain-containing protein [Microbacterium sp. ET2]|uniref:SIP domain-containing protein n=1 Tax=Microbacterium albipurpureum TaxID=3050384 RepID=UPI00259C92BE|nr:SIP domain-containing protein [Microbacterium sp. ET2 (Ac-2212)]WJL95177.1 SIP domain-containing protein [Microbacterium sp. ET2 (Ac-2212)]
MSKIIPSLTEHNTAACRSSRHTRVQHVIAADESSLVELETLLATLPLCSTGRVFIEIPDDASRSDIAVPPRMVLTWLDRSRRSGAPGTGRGCASGEALSRAVIAWADEMLCDDGDATRIHLLGGYLGTVDIVEHLTGVRGIDPSHIYTPARYGLSSAR